MRGPIPYPGIWDSLWGDEFAFAMAVSPFGACILALSGPGGSAWATLLLLPLLQAWLAIGDRVRLDGMGTDTTGLPSLPGSLFAPAYLVRRGRVLGRSQEFVVVWCCSMLLASVPLFALAFPPSSAGTDHAAACMRPHPVAGPSPAGAAFAGRSHRLAEVDGGRGADDAYGRLGSGGRIPSARSPHGCAGRSMGPEGGSGPSVDGPRGRGH